MLWLTGRVLACGDTSGLNNPLVENIPKVEEKKLEIKIYIQALWLLTMATRQSFWLVVASF